MDIDNGDEYVYSDSETSEREFEYSDDEGLESHAGVDDSATDTNLRLKKPRSSSSRTSAEYRVIESDELDREIQVLVDDVSSVLNIPPKSAGVLLRHFRWNKEKLLDKYYECPEAVEEDAGIRFSAVEEGSFPEDSVECLICRDTHPGNETFALGCSHRFCQTCWETYLVVKVEEGPKSIFTLCPSSNCKEVVDEKVFATVLRNSPNALAKYRRFVQLSYVDINKSIRWCTSVMCNKALVSTGAPSEVECACGHKFCFRCAEEPHAPVSCETLAKWLEKCANESETANWILANTKRCPVCSVRIEKNQGCNHMTCVHCRHEFCWTCSGPWAEHGSTTGGYYKCNKYDPTVNVEEGDAAKAKAELNRYLHYYQRFANHAQAGKFAEKQLNQAETRMVQLQESSKSSWIDVQFLKSAAEMLITCRRVLKYTYVFAYYLPQGKEKNLFEYLQENLEKNVEHLAELSEMPLSKINKTELVNYSRVTHTFLRNLLSGTVDMTPFLRSLVAKSNLKEFQRITEQE